MNRRSVMALGGMFALVAGPATAQTPSPEPETRRVEEVRIVHGPGSGADADVLLGGGADLPWMVLGGEPEAVLDDSVKAAPFSAEAITESVQTLSDGNRIVRNSTTSMARDGEGRTRREQPTRARLSSTGDGPTEPGTMITISDPVAGERYVLDPEKRTARKLPRMFFRRPGAPGADVIVEHKDGGTFDVEIRRLPADGAPPPPPPPPPADGATWVAREDGVSMLGPDVNAMRWSSDDVQVEELGTREIEGVQANGTRRTVTIAAGAIGNEQPIHIVSERWYAPELKTVVLTRRSDPRMGEHTYRLASIVRGEPDPSLFQVPADYTVVAMPEPRVQIQRRVAPPPQP